MSFSTFYCIDYLHQATLLCDVLVKKWLIRTCVTVMNQKGRILPNLLLFLLTASLHLFERMDHTCGVQYRQKPILMFFFSHELVPLEVFTEKTVFWPWITTMNTWFFTSNDLHNAIFVEFQVPIYLSFQRSCFRSPNSTSLWSFNTAKAAYLAFNFKFSSWLPILVTSVLNFLFHTMVYFYNITSCSYAARIQVRQFLDNVRLNTDCHMNICRNKLFEYKVWHLVSHFLNIKFQVPTKLLGNTRITTLLLGLSRIVKRAKNLFKRSL